MKLTESIKNILLIESKIEKMKQDIIDQIKHQYNVDITKYINNSSDKNSRKYFNVYLDDMPKNDKNNIIRLSKEKYSKFDIQDNGGLGYAFFYKKD